MANLRTNNLSGEQGQNAIRGSVFFKGNVSSSGDIPTDYLSVADHDDLDMGTGDFTFECWLLATKYTGLNDPSFMGFCSSQDWTAGGMLIQVANTGVLRIAVPLSGGGYLSELGSTNIYNVKGHDWVHIAVVKTSGTIKGYVNGVEEISASYNVGVDFAHGGTCTIGENGINQYLGDYAFRGYISNLRLTKGLARYTSTFTPPAFELTADADTVLLCCQDSDDPTQEATGKSITAIGNFRSDKNKGNLIRNALDWDGAASSFSTTMPHGWTAGNGAQVQYESGGNTASGGFGDYGAGAEGRMLRLRNDGNNSFINQEIPTVIGQAYRFRFWFEAQNSGLGMRMNAGTSAGDTTNLGDQFNVGSDGDESERTKFFIATATTTHISIQIISGTDGASVFIDNVVVDAVNPLQPKIIPPYGVDAGNTFGGSIQQSTEGYMYFPTGRTEERGRGRAIWGGGQNPSNKVVMDYFQIQTGGIAIDFGNLSDARNEVRACGSSTRGVWAGGRDPGLSNIIDFVEIPTTANAVDFGNLTVARAAVAAVSNSTRGCFMAGFAPSNTNHIDFITIASLGDATDFGDMLGNYQAQGRAMSPTRGLAAGNYGASNLIEFITIATTGNSTDFGDRTVAAYSLSGTSDNTRGVFTGGDGPTTNVIDFVTMASAGNAADFGDLTTANGSSHADTSNSILGCIAGGQSNTDAISQITIQTLGNAIQWGDLTSGRSQLGATSDSHGGLS